MLLLVPCDPYRQAHELPGGYPALSAVTPASVWTVGTYQAQIEQIRAALGSGPAVLRDYVTSMKHHWDQASFIPDVADADTVRKVINRFLELREDAFVGGLVLRRYEHFLGAEARTWWVRARCVLTGAHPDTPDQTPSADLDVAALAPLVAGLRLPFVSLDLAARDDGTWRVIELGDGQVSDRPATLEPRRLLQALI